MAHVQGRQPLLPSILDRLMDEDPGGSTEPRWSQTLTELKNSVRNDLEALLNTRQSHTPVEAGAERNRSVLCYGMPDFTSSSADSSEQRDQLRRAVEQTIRSFETRLSHVQVTLHEADNVSDRTLRMTVEAVLNVEPHPERVTFDTVVRPFSGECEVRES